MAITQSFSGYIFFTKEKMNTKPCIATKVPGIVKCFLNPQTGHGVIFSLDEHEDVSVLQSAIVNGKPLGEGEMVELDILIGSKGLEAANVTVAEGESDAMKKRNNLISPFANLWSPDSFRSWMLGENSISLHTKELLYQNLNRRELDGTENVIRFQIIDKDMSPESGGYGSLNEPIPFVSLSNVEKDVGRMLDVDEIVVPEEVKSISVVFNYPLKQNFVFELESPTGKGFTRGQLATVIAYKYQEIYKVISPPSKDIGFFICFTGGERNFNCA